MDVFEFKKLEWSGSPFPGFPEEKEIKEYLTKILRAFAPYCSNLNHFLNEAITHPINRWWEMYLGYLMLKNGFQLDKAPHKGPDLLVLLKDGKKLWIEATSVDGGKAFPTQHVQSGSFSDEPYLLRLTSGVTDKLEKIEGYIKNGIIKSDDYVIIAINVGKFNFFGGDGPCYPAIAKVAFGIGSFAIRWSIEDGAAIGEPEGFHQGRPNVLKKPETSISTNLFSVPEYHPVSALMYSRINHGYMFEDGRDITTTYNPKAKNKLREDVFNFGKRTFFDGKIIRFQKNENNQWVDDESGF